MDKRGGGGGHLVLPLNAAILGALFLPVLSISYDEIFALDALKKSIYEDPYSVLADWNSNGDPCDWTGVNCSAARDHVVAINLSNSSLKGFLAPELGSLTSLQELILSHNLFLGAIPKQIGMLKNLSVLDLSVNRLSGPIPPEIGNFKKISKINFHSNGLTGVLPLEIGNLISLLELRLDRNRLQGPIPASNNSPSPPNNSMYASKNIVAGLCSLKQLKIGDFSYNFLVGKIPSCLGYLPRSSFQGNCFHDKNSILQRSTQQCGGSGPATSSGNSSSAKRHEKMQSKHQKARQPLWLLILEIITGVMSVILLVTVIATAVKRYKPKSSLAIPRKKRTTVSREQMLMSIDAEMLNHVLKISRQELEVACEDFSNIIGSSSDSIVYKGTMKDGSEIAVIALCISEDQWTNYLQLSFQTEVANLARINHESTAKLFGYCEENDPFSRMLVFEYASNGTLYEHLHYGEGYQLSWSRRMKIAIGIARGLKYLHVDLQPPFSLSELHSSAIYLTEDFSPKLVDFESWKAVPLKSAKNSGYFINGGAFNGGYESPGRSQTDVQENTFAFGVLLLEIISGRLPYCKDRGCLVNWATEYLEGLELMCHLVDPELRYFNHDDLRVICSVASLCIQPEPSKRPSMQILTSMLENGIDTSAAANLKESPLAWAELALSS